MSLGMPVKSSVLACCIGCKRQKTHIFDDFLKLNMCKKVVFVRVFGGVLDVPATLKTSLYVPVSYIVLSLLLLVYGMC